jgi:RND family efflux transporter MFP subunit
MDKDSTFRPRALAPCSRLLGGRKFVPLIAAVMLWGMTASVHSASSVAPGVTRALKEVKLSLTVAGRVESVLVKEGQHVSKGQVLLFVDRTAEELEVKRRRLLLEDVSRLNELRARERVLTEQVSALRPLVASGGVSRKQLEDEELALRSVAAEVRSLEAAKKREYVELDLAFEAFERRHLRTSISGVVSKIIPRAGESVAPHDAIVHVVDVSRVRFVANVPVALGRKLRVGARVQVRLGTEATGDTRDARVVFVSPVADPSSGLFETMAEFDNADGSVRPGVTGRLLF